MKVLSYVMPAVLSVPSACGIQSSHSGGALGGLRPGLSWSASHLRFFNCAGSAGTRRHPVRLGDKPVQNKCGNSSLNRFNMLDAGPSRVYLDEPINSILQEKLRATF